MSSPFEGAPSLPFDTANGAPLPRPAITDDELDAELAKLNPPRKYYQNYQRTRGANDDMLHAPQGLHAFFRAYYFYKSADYKGNNPHPLKARTAEEMAQIPTYYVMEKDKGMAATVAPFMPPADYIANCKWLTEAEVDVYATEYGRTGFTGALQGYRVRRGSDPRSIAEMHTFRAAPSTCPLSTSRGKAIGASIKRRVRSTRCAPAPARTWSDSIFSMAPDIGCSRSSRNRSAHCCFNSCAITPRITRRRDRPSLT